jgi:histidinol-phosphatase (PHP family)
MEAYVEQAILQGRREIGFSDHNPLPHGLGANVRMKESELDYYVNRVIELRHQYHGKIEVLLGLEMDFVDGLEDYLARQIASYPFDYIIGSVHYLNRDCTIGSWTRHYPASPDEQWIRYCEQLRKLAHSGLCDILAHLDVVKRSAKQPTQRGLDAITATLEDIATTGLCIEINTSGYRHTELIESQPYPDLPFVEKALALGIPLTVNSDAHAPEQVGFKFAETETFLKKHGCRQLACFEQRRRSFYIL